MVSIPFSCFASGQNYFYFSFIFVSMLSNGIVNAFRLYFNSGAQAAERPKNRSDAERWNEGGDLRRAITKTHPVYYSVF